MARDLNECIIQKFEEESTYQAKLGKYEKRIRKKAKKNKRLKRQIKLLEEQNESLRQELEKQNEKLCQKLKVMERKYKKLKKNVQYERYQLGVNPFMPMDIFADFKKGNKKKKPQINVCYMQPWSSGIAEMEKQPPVIMDASFREVKHG